MSSNPYESRRIVSEYLAFHYQSEKQIFPYPAPQFTSDNFSVRCARLCQQLSGGRQIPRALDLGCGVGRSTFELSRCSAEVVGIDFSSRFIQAARHLQKRHSLQTKLIQEGKIQKRTTLSLPKGVFPHRIHFQKGDAHRLPKSLGTFNLVLMANLIDRLHSPIKCIKQLPDLILPGGWLVITSPYTWLESFTPRRNWLGSKGSASQNTLRNLVRMLKPHFQFLTSSNLPFLIREHARKFQLGMAQATVWKRIHPK